MITFKLGTDIKGAINRKAASGKKDAKKTGAGKSPSKSMRVD
jgi:hypothetical protein